MIEIHRIWNFSITRNKQSIQISR